jgi:hypothetical protein
MMNAKESVARRMNLFAASLRGSECQIALAVFNEEAFTHLAVVGIVVQSEFEFRVALRKIESILATTSRPDRLRFFAEHNLPESFVDLSEFKELVTLKMRADLQKTSKKSAS